MDRSISGNPTGLPRIDRLNYLHTKSKHSNKSNRSCGDRLSNSTKHRLYKMVVDKPVGKYRYNRPDNKSETE